MSVILFLFGIGVELLFFKKQNLPTHSFLGVGALTGLRIPRHWLLLEQQQRNMGHLDNVSDRACHGDLALSCQAAAIRLQDVANPGTNEPRFDTFGCNPESSVQLGTAFCFLQPPVRAPSQ